MNGSFKISGPHYFGIPALNPEFVSQTSRNLVKPEQIKSGIPEPNTVTLRPYNLSMPQLPQIFTGTDGVEYAREKTSGRRYVIPYSEYLELGRATQLDDLGFLSWKATGENPKVREEVRIPQKSVNYGLMESFGERQLKLPEGDTPVNLFVHDFSYNGPINDVGRYSHLVRNLKQTLMNNYGTKDLQRLAADLQSKGMPLEDIGWIASGLVPKNTIYGVARLPDGKILFVGAEDSFDKMVREARYHGLKREDIEFLRIGEEITHIGRKSYDRSVERIGEEKATKRTLRDIVLEMAEGADGNPELVRHYLKLAEFMEGDIRTTRKRYSKSSFSSEENLDARLEEPDGKGRVIYARGRFGKDYRERAAEAEKTAEPDARSDAKAESAEETPEPSEQAAEQTAEAA
ncbi:hypothetical protein HYX06_00875 [Candidatus Woesearchaeota archaeon]|nr:hypothetical protein [Candidatus Woesearchaeota archaeon]